MHKTVQVVPQDRSKQTGTEAMNFEQRPSTSAPQLSRAECLLAAKSTKFAREHRRKEKRCVEINAVNVFTSLSTTLHTCL